MGQGGRERHWAPSCRSCLHWRPQWCQRELMVYPWGGPGRCDGFDYEPGSDERVDLDEREARDGA